MRADVVVAVEVGIQPVESQEFGSRADGGLAEEIIKVTLEGGHRDEADRLEIILQRHLGGARAPSLDPGVVDLDLIVWRRRIFGIGQGHAATVLVEVGPPY